MCSEILEMFQSWPLQKSLCRLSKKCSLLFGGLQLFKSTLASESSYDSQYYQMVLKTQAGNKHGFDTLLPIWAFSVQASWVNYLSSHRRNPGFCCSSLSQDMVRNCTGFWACSLWMCVTLATICTCKYESQEFRNCKGIFFVVFWASEILHRQSHVEQKRALFDIPVVWWAWSEHLLQSSLSYCSAHVCRLRVHFIYLT